MRIVHEFHSKHPSVGGSGQHYLPPVDRPMPEFPGFQVELAITDGPKPGADVIHLEGDGASVRAMLLSALEVVDMLEKDCRDSWRITRRQIKACDACRKWVATDSHGVIQEHACMAKEPPEGEAAPPEAGPPEGDEAPGD